MAPVWALVFFLLFVFLGGALLAPWLYAAVQALAPSHDLWAVLAKHPFHRYVTRCFMVLALVGLWPLFRSLGLRHWRETGLTRGRGSRRDLLIGLSLGFISLAVIALLELAVGIRAIDMERTPSMIRRHMFNAISAACLASIAEELIFRAGLFGGLRRRHEDASNETGRLGSTRAMWLSSIVYALVHFFEQPQNPATVDWTSGFLILGRMLGGFTDFQLLVPAFFNLTLAGIILATAYERTGRLWLSIGLHAGWIFWLKSFGFFTVARGEGSWFWGTPKMIDGWAALPILSALFFIVRFWAGKVRAGHDAPGASE